MNAASYLPGGLPGGAIARGSIFTIFGSNLGPSSSPKLAFPLNSTLGGVSIKVTGNSVVDAIPLFVSPSQINAIMPSTAPLGLASIVVTFNSQVGKPAPVQVVNSSVGIFTANVTGDGPGIATNYITGANQPINSTAHTAKPGQIVTLWGTGLGPVPYADNIPPSAGSLPVPTEVFVGGKAATIAYNGRTPCCAGLDQIVVTIPPDAPTGCWVPVQVRTGGTVVSNTFTMAISSDGSPCSDPANPYAQEVLHGGKVGHINLTRGASLYTIVQSPPTNITVDTVNAEFVQASQGKFPFNAALSLPPAGSCRVMQGSGNYFQPRSSPNFFVTQILNAGSSLTLTDRGTRTVALPLKGQAQLGKNLPGGTLTNSVFLEPGTIAFSGAGGVDVGAFHGSVTSPAAITWTNQSQISSVDRNQPLTVTWNGTAAGQIVEIVGASVDLPTHSSAKFLCIAPANAGTFTVPSAILQSLPPTRTTGLQMKGSLSVGVIGDTTTFTATGLDFGIASVSFFSGQPVLYQ